MTTFEEFEKLPDPSGGHYELHHGQVVLAPFRQKTRLLIEQGLIDVLRPLLHSKGMLACQLPFRPEIEHQYWVAGIGFIAQARWDADNSDYFLVAPDLVIEVLSRSNTMDEILDRQEICLRNGCIAFWVVGPRRQTIMATTPQGITRTYDRASVVPLPEPWNGTIEVAAVFKK